MFTFPATGVIQGFEWKGDMRTGVGTLRMALDAARDEGQISAWEFDTPHYLRIVRHHYRLLVLFPTMAEALKAKLTVTGFF